MAPISKTITTIAPACYNCLYYKIVKEGEPAKCHIFYRQHPTHSFSYFETADANRKDPRFCGPEGRWFLGKGNICIDSLNKKQECYDK